MKTILLVDDEYALVESLTDLLENEGYRVVSAANGRDGLARLEKEKPDLVLTDIMMPIADGRELIRGMRATPGFRATPVVVVSATTKAVALWDSNGPLEVSAFVTKPFQWENLLATILGLIGSGEKGPTGCEP